MPGIVGHNIELDRHAYTVIGVMPKTTQYPSVADFFLPFAPSTTQLADRASHDYLVIGRLRKGLTAEPGAGRDERHR